MTTDWDLDARAQGTEDSNKKDFTKFPEGITHIRVLDPAPNQRWVHWLNQFSRSITCPGRACPICEIRSREKKNKIDYTYNLQKKFAMQVYNHSTGRLEIMDEGRMFMDDLVLVKNDLNDKKKPLVAAVLKVRKTGEGRDSKYRIDVSEESELNEKELAAFDNIIDLEEYYEATPPEKILELLAVTEKHTERFVEILFGDKDDEVAATTEESEQIETE